MSDWKAPDDRTRRAEYLQKLTGEVSAEERSALQTSESVGEAARFMRQMRLAAKLTQKQLGEKLGVTQERICELEKGASPEGMSYALLRRTALECGLPDWPAPPMAQAEMAAEKTTAIDPADVMAPVAIGEVFEIAIDYAGEGKKRWPAGSADKIFDRIDWHIIKTVHPRSAELWRGATCVAFKPKFAKGVMRKFSKSDRDNIVRAAVSDAVSKIVSSE